MKYLILLTRKYPFLSGEPFLENEIAEIAPYFDKVCIFPTDPGKSDKATRSLKSDNVDVCVISKKNLHLRRYEYAVTGIVNSIVSRKLKKEQIHDACFLAFANSFSSAIENYISEHYSWTHDDEVVIYSYWLYVTAKIAINLKSSFQCAVKRITCVSRAHRFDIYEEMRGYLPFQKQMVEGMDRIYPCSQNGTDYLKQKYPQFEGKIETSYLGTYDHGINKVKEQTTFHIVSCSRVTEIKRIDLIIDALKLLQNEQINIVWTHIGDGKLFEHIKKRAKEELPHIHTEFTGMLQNKEVYNFYKCNTVNLFINVSSSEGLPVSIMEAISFGIPVIATDVGGTSEIVINKVSGDLIPKKFAVSHLTDLIRKYCYMGNVEIEMLRERTRKLWEEKYCGIHNYKTFANKLLFAHEQ